MGYIGFLISTVCFALMFIVPIPFLRWLDWLLVPFSLAGLVISAIGTSRHSGRTLGIFGVIICAIVLVVSSLRLIIGGGVM